MNIMNKEMARLFSAGLYIDPLTEVDETDFILGGKESDMAIIGGIVR